jgi:inner membrane protein
MLRPPMLQSTTVKLFLLGGLALLLLIPLGMIHDLVRERAGLAAEAEARIAAGWGGTQTLLLPMLRAQYRRTVGDGDELRHERAERLLSPSSAGVEARLHTELRSLGIHSLPVYTNTLRIAGRFEPELIERELPPGVPWLLERVDFVFAPGDLTGLQSLAPIEIGGTTVTVSPSSLRWPLGSPAPSTLANGRGVLSGALTAAMLTAPVEFRMSMELAGSRAFAVIPNAGQFEQSLTGDWPHPSFAGGLLPREREVTDTGFAASWRTHVLSSGLPLVVAHAESIAGWEGQALGVWLVEPGGLYQQNERSTKYGILVLALTLLGLFLAEVLAGIRLHPFHYLLVGLALAVFYLLLLALSEHIGFVGAYSSAGAAVAAMVGGYAAAVLGGWRQGLLTGTLLGALYGFLLVLIRSEEMALLLGAIGLALLLATTMYLTRRIDWYATTPASAATP